MKKLQDKLKLYAITDKTWSKGNFLEDIEKALQGGVTVLQWRDKNHEKNEDELAKVFSLCKSYNVPLIINDDPEYLKLVDADGIHIGQDDLPCKMVRNFVGADKIIGVSVHTVQEAIQAEQDGADYLGVGAIFPTETKKEATLVTIQELKAICQSVKIPVIAIGGITKDNIDQLKNTGIVGVAVIHAIFSAKDISKAVKDLRREVEQWDD